MGLGDIDKSDLKKRFCYVELEAGKELERKDFKENHYILFFLSGKPHCAAVFQMAGSGGSTVQITASAIHFKHFCAVFCFVLSEPSAF